MTNAWPSNPDTFRKRPRYALLAVFVVAGALLALPLFNGSASAPTAPVNKTTFTEIDNTTAAVPGVLSPGFNFLTPMPQSGPVSVETFAGDCTTPKTVFNV